jgi:hypothetical protein
MTKGRRQVRKFVKIVVLIMRQEGGSIDEGLSNGQKLTIPEARRRYLSSVEDEKLHSPILPGGHGCGQSKWM